MDRTESQQNQWISGTATEDQSSSSINTSSGKKVSFWPIVVVKEYEVGRKYTVPSSSKIQNTLNRKYEFLKDSNYNKGIITKKNIKSANKNKRKLNVCFWPIVTIKSGMLGDNLRWYEAINDEIPYKNININYEEINQTVNMWCLRHMSKRQSGDEGESEGIQDNPSLKRSRYNLRNKSDKSASDLNPDNITDIHMSTQEGSADAITKPGDTDSVQPISSQQSAEEIGEGANDSISSLTSIGSTTTELDKCILEGDIDYDDTSESAKSAKLKTKLILKEIRTQWAQIMHNSKDLLASTNGKIMIHELEEMHRYNNNIIVRSEQIIDENPTLEMCFRILLKVSIHFTQIIKKLESLFGTTWNRGGMENPTDNLKEVIENIHRLSTDESADESKTQSRNKEFFKNVSEYCTLMNVREMQREKHNEILWENTTLIIKSLMQCTITTTNAIISIISEVRHLDKIQLEKHDATAANLSITPSESNMKTEAEVRKIQYEKEEEDRKQAEIPEEIRTKAKTIIFTTGESNEFYTTGLPVGNGMA